ncbi:MAG: PQQ-binding-like beta-propeller repeat protein [bacterium]
MPQTSAAASVWPPSPWHSQDSLDYVEWGTAAWNDPWLYAGRSNDSIYRLLVTDTSLTYVRSVGLGAAAMVGPQAIDAGGNVYFGTDSGYLYKLTADLDLVWRVPLQANGEVHGPAIGADGTIYTVTDQGKLYAINTADGSTRWTRQLESEGSRPAVGDGAVFVGTSFGRFYAVNTSDGSIRWERRLGSSEFSTTPILTTKGLMYAVNEVDILYCVRMSDGEVIWSCDCPMFLPDRRGRTWMQTVDYAPNPGITSRGDIIVVGSDALYCVKGYPDGLLDTSQPWPKWQHDRYNSGKQ